LIEAQSRTTIQALNCLDLAAIENSINLLEYSTKLSNRQVANQHILLLPGSIDITRLDQLSVGKSKS
jgi:hypothetical protein